MVASYLEPVIVDSEEAMEALGRCLGPQLPAGAIVELQGELGAGKTTLVRGMLRGLGYEDAVTSPTYTLLETYPMAERTVCHFDLYRLESPEELESLGLRDLLDGETVLLIEWPDRGRGHLPEATHEISIDCTAGHRAVCMHSRMGTVELIPC